jgi:hypothetical protein
VGEEFAISRIKLNIYSTTWTYTWAILFECVNNQQLIMEKIFSIGKNSRCVEGGWLKLSK